MAGEGTTFYRDFKRLAEIAKGQLEAAVLEGIQDVAERVVTTTPVDTGNLRASWFATIGAPAEDAPTKEAGSDPTPEIALALDGYSLGETVYLQTGAAYAMRVEFGFVGEDSLGRKYNQEGRGFVRAAVAEADSIFEAAAKRVAAGQSGGERQGGGGAVGGKGYTQT